MSRDNLTFPFPPTRLPATPPTQIGHKQEGSSNIIPAMPQFATACHIHKVGLQIHLQALGPLKYGGHSFPHPPHPCLPPPPLPSPPHRPPPPPSHSPPATPPP